MKTKVLTTILILLFTQTTLFATKYAGEIFKMGAGVRNFSLGKTGLTDQNSPALAYWNASLLLDQEDNRLELMHAEEFSGLLKYDTFSGSIGNANKIGFTFTRIGVNDIKLTKLENPDAPIGENNKPYKYKSINNADYILYLGIARKLGSFPLGLTPKLVYRDIAETSAYGFGADLSTHYKANDSFVIALRIRDIIPTQLYYDTGTRDVVKIGFDAEAKIMTKLPVIGTPVYLYLNSEINTDGMWRSAYGNIGEVSFDPHIGAEFVFHPRFSFFTGINIEQFTTGLGLNYQNFLLNYCFEQNSSLDNSHRFSIGYIF